MADAKTSGKMSVRPLPKNIRQIGTSTGETRIYLEDYVYTYLHSNEKRPEWTKKGFLLLGHVECVQDHARYYISGLIRLTDAFFKENVLEFDDGAWAYIYQEMKKYYEDLEIVGWGQDISRASASLTAELERVHKHNFNVQKNVMLLLDVVEKEEGFYVFEHNMLQRRDGYYVYYEKNPQMQEYMIQSSGSRELNISEEEIKEPVIMYRDTMQERRMRQHIHRWNGILYTTSLLLVLAVCVLGVSTINNVEKMQHLESTVAQISADESEYDENIERKENELSDENPPQQLVMDQEKKKQEEQAEEADGDKAESEKLVSDSLTEGASAIEDTDPEEATEEVLDTDDAETTDTAAIAEAQAYLLQGYYIVQKGDSLSSISQKIYGTFKKAEEISRLNGLDDVNKIFVGQKLRLP